MGRVPLVRAIAALALLLASPAPAAAVPVEPGSGESPLPAPSPRLVGYRIPVDAPLVLAPELIPGAPREYRGGTHEGVDIAAPDGAPVRAARAGKILRIDRSYVERSAAERRQALAEAIRGGGTPAELLDRVRGRQVWIDHGDGVVTRYAHLGSVAYLAVGEHVFEGSVSGRSGPLACRRAARICISSSGCATATSARAWRWRTSGRDRARLQPGASRARV